MNNLISCPITEEDKHRELCELMTDMQAILKLQSSLQFTESRAEYVAALNEYIKEALLVVAREYVELYDLAPIDH